MTDYRRNFCGIIKERLIDYVSFRTFAEEVEPSGNTDNEPNNEPTPIGGDTGTLNYEDLIAKARKEEKEKQYSTIERLKGQVSTLTEQHNKDLLRTAELEKQISDAKANRPNDSEEVAELKSKIEELNSKNAELTKITEGIVEREVVEAEVRAELEKEYEVKNYRVTKMAEMKDDILVPELVFGTTKEEIDESIQKAIERSNEIKKNLGVKMDPRVPNSPSNPSVSSVQDSDVSLEQLSSMDVRSPEYAQLRKKIGLR